MLKLTQLKVNFQQHTSLYFSTDVTHLPGFYTQFETHVQLPAPAVAAHTDVVINTRGKADLVTRYIKQPRIQLSTHFLLSPLGLREPTLPSFRDPLRPWTLDRDPLPRSSHFSPSFLPFLFLLLRGVLLWTSIRRQYILLLSKNSLLLSEYLEDLTFHCQ